jgi:hypothetical protein
MKLQHPWRIFPLLVLTACLTLAPALCRAQLLPPGDFNGKSLDEWTLDWGEWAIRIAPDLGGQTLPDTVNGVRYLSPNYGSVFVQDLTIPQGTAVVLSPYFIFGESYDDGTQDMPSDIADFMLFENATIRTTLNGSVVLEGLASNFPERKTSIRTFSEPIAYVVPQNRGNHNATAAIFEQGIGAMFELPIGEHTIMNVYSSNFFGGPFSATYNITVVPEPSTLVLLGSVMVGQLACLRRNPAHRQLMKATTLLSSGRRCRHAKR